MLLCTCLILSNPLSAQEPPAIPYRVQITPDDDKALGSAIQGVSQLIKLEETAPTDGYGLLARARVAFETTGRDTIAVRAVRAIAAEWIDVLRRLRVRAGGTTCCSC